MFTGIIQKKGLVTKIQKNNTDYLLTIKQNEIASHAELGDSISVNGVCLTVIDRNNDEFTVELMNETRRLTTFNFLNENEEVNLEPSLNYNGKIGGHFVLGHVDGIGEIIDIKDDGVAKIFRIKTEKDIVKHIIYKGCVAIDGISLTVSKVTNEYFEVSIIPFTLQETILSNKKITNLVNIENDYFVRCVLKYSLKEGSEE